MKKLLLFVSSVALTIGLHAQSAFVITELAGGAAAQSHYTMCTDTNDVNVPTFTNEFKIQNVSGANKLVKIRKVLLSVATSTVTGMNHDIYFCYNITCYTPFVYYSTATVPAGGSLPNGSGTSYGLRAEMDQNKVIGTSVARYTIYDSLNTSDSMNITITYCVTAPSAIKNNNSSVFVSNAAPNPAGNSINFSYELNSVADAQVKIFNCLGNLVKTVTLNPATKGTQVDVSNLEEGFYFYSVIANGKATSTRRLVIAR